MKRIIKFQRLRKKTKINIWAKTQNWISTLGGKSDQNNKVSENHEETQMGIGRYSKGNREKEY